MPTTSCQHHWTLQRRQHPNLRRGGPGHSPAVQPGSCGHRAGQAAGRRQERGRLGPVRGVPAWPTPAPRATPRRRRSPNTRMFLPAGSLDLARVDTSLRMEDLWGQWQSGQPQSEPGPHRPEMARQSVRRSGPARRLPGRPRPPRPGRPSPTAYGLTISSGPPLPHWSGRRRLPPRARWDPEAPSSPPPPAPSCQLQPQRGPSPGPAEDPRGPWLGRPPPAAAGPPSPSPPRAALHVARPAGFASPAALRLEGNVRRLPQGREAASPVGGGRRSGGSRGSHAQGGCGGSGAARTGRAGGLYRPRGATAPRPGSSPRWRLPLVGARLPDGRTPEIQALE